MIKPCCQDFGNCRELCVVRADYWQGQASQLSAELAARSTPRQGEAVVELRMTTGGTVYFNPLIPFEDLKRLPQGAKLYAATPLSVEPATTDPHAPRELFLQLYGDSSADEGPVDYKADEVTWCWHRIHDSDVRYVQAAPWPERIKPAEANP